MTVQFDGVTQTCVFLLVGVVITKEGGVVPLTRRRRLIKVHMMVIILRTSDTGLGAEVLLLVVGEVLGHGMRGVGPVGGADGGAQRGGHPHGRGRVGRRGVGVVRGVDGVVDGVVVTVLGHLGADLVPQDPADGGDGGDVGAVADPAGEEPVPDLPGEDPGVLLLELLDEGHHFGGGDAGLAPADGAREDGAGLVVAGQDLGDAPVGDPQLPRDVARSDPQVGQLHDPPSHLVRQRSTVHEQAAQLVHLAIRLPAAIAVS